MKGFLQAVFALALVQAVAAGCGGCTSTNWVGTPHNRFVVMSAVSRSLWTAVRFGRARLGPAAPLRLTRIVGMGMFATLRTPTIVATSTEER